MWKWALLEMVKGFIDAGIDLCVRIKASYAYAKVPRLAIGRAAHAQMRTHGSMRCLQDDNVVAATQDFFEPTANPPYNRQHTSQGWRDNQPIRGNPPPQQQGQQRQPYT
ncbi:hypothetical protein PIB30_089166 [Stylosanthes scabra]|uniref:Uncharacterized protein n=1 Tax=Stylosanthes scabra TaxID=79078 RepID=A0ABU6QVB0_9FABA|nr:hypothetical protein [Stylosanthes scabra]